MLLLDVSYQVDCDGSPKADKPTLIGAGLNSATYNQLVIFQAIVTEGSIRGAARKLGMAAPSVSQALKRLEKTLGLPLFTRTTRRIALTEAGRLLHERATPALSSLNYAIESIQDLINAPSGKVRLTVPRFAWQLFLAPVYAEFCKLYPDIKLEISVSDASVNLVQEDFDLGIRFGGRIEEGMATKRLTPPMREVLFASTDYLARHGTPETPYDLQRHKLVQYRFITSNQLAPLILNHNGEELTVEMPTAMVVNDMGMMADAGKKGIGIGRVAEPAISAALSAGTVKPVLEEYWKKYPGLYAYFPQNSQQARRIRVFLDFLDAKALRHW